LGQDLDPTRRRPDDIDLLANSSHLSRTLEYDNQPRTDRAGPSSSSFARLLTVTAARIPEGWDESVTALHGHFLQTCAWARVQEQLGNRAIVGADRDWCWMGVVKRVGPLRYLYVSLGPSLRTPDALDAALSLARERARRLGCAFVRRASPQMTICGPPAPTAAPT
jgi:hypothetical protein